ncbi:hypothetical protein FQN54_002183 [Arachnomyces sp. PD_36]|nr:hypothetical protein FQN54_002183 [Arachnomyces sp. PD_36]
MQLPTTALGLLHLSAAASATILESRQLPGLDQVHMGLAEFCVPGMNAEKQDRSAPCYRAPDIAYACMVGVDSLEEVEELPDDTKEASLEVQQECICGSEMFDLFKGCSNCFKLHGGVENVDYLNDEYYDSVSSKFCGGEPTISLNDLMMKSPQTATAGTTNSDVLGTQTAASLYYTAPTAAASDGGANPTGTGTEPSGTGAQPTETGAASALGAGAFAPLAGALMVIGMLG